MSYVYTCLCVFSYIVSMKPKQWIAVPWSLLSSH